MSRRLAVRYMFRPGAIARTLLLLAALLLLGSPGGYAQDTLHPRYGIVGGYALNGHTADFRALPGVPNCCPRFQGGTGSGFFGGILSEFPLSDLFLLSLRGGYAMHDARLAEREAVTVIVEGEGRQGAFEHSVDAATGSIGLEPALMFRFAEGAYLSLGARGGIYLGARYEQEERIVEPTDGGTFLDSTGADSRSRVRNASAGDIPNVAPFLLQGIAAVGYEFPLNARGTFLLAPELSYALSFTDVVDGLTWKANAFRAGIALKYSPAPEPPKPFRYDTLFVRDTASERRAGITEPRLTLLGSRSASERLEGPDTIVVRTTINESYLRETPLPPPMTCALTASGVDDDGGVSPMAVLRIEEFLSTTAHPLLNYVFFEPNAGELPVRYVTLGPAEADAFRTESLYGSGTLEVYHTVLNIIGERMRRYPRATLTLTGHNMDQEGEKGNIELSRRRAETVRDYLVNVWGIDGGRLKVDAANLPVRRSNPLTPDGQGENRRVEIVSDMPEILDVLLANDTTRVSVPPIVRLFPSVVSSQGAASWEIAITQGGTLLKRFAGSGSVPASIDWDLANDPASVPRYDGPLTIALTATNPAGENVACRLELPTEVTTLRKKRENRVGDYTIDRYNLILFSVGESTITPRNERIVNLVKSRLKPASELTIEGFADRSGNPASNRRLSGARATMTAQALGRPDATIRGIGEDRLLYDNSTPEGRYYCRTVQILVKTPVGE